MPCESGGKKVANLSDDRINVLAIPGSLRDGSFNRGLLRAAREVAGPGIEVEIYDLRGLPIYDGDVEAQGDPAAVTALKEAVRSADALLLATPEYNGGTSGALKNAIDWASRSENGWASSPIAGKTVAIIGGGGGGGARGGLAQLRQVLASIGIRAIEEPEVAVARVWDRFDGNGNLADEAVRERIAGLVSALAALVERQRALAA